MTRSPVESCKSLLLIPKGGLLIYPSLNVTCHASQLFILVAAPELKVKRYPEALPNPGLYVKFSLKVVRPPIFVSSCSPSIASAFFLVDDGKNVVVGGAVVVVMEYCEKYSWL